MSKELTFNYNQETNVVDLKDIPGAISDCFAPLNKLEAKIRASEKAAEEAKKKAEESKEKSAGFGKKRAAIEANQESIEALAQAQAHAAEAQKLTFDYQKKLAEASKYLFMLGVSNIAANRMVCRELDMKMNGASKEQIRGLARQEIGNVIRQLKAQEDIMMKQENQKDILKLHDQSIDDIKYSIKEIEKSDVKQNEELKEHRDAIVIIGQKDDIQDGILKNHEESISTAVNENKNQNKKIQELDEDIDAIEGVNKNQDELLKSHDADIDKNEENIGINRESIDANKENININKAYIEKNSKKISSLIEEISALKLADDNARKEIAKARIIALAASSVSAAALILSALIAFGVI